METNRRSDAVTALARWLCSLLSVVSQLLDEAHSRLRFRLLPAPPTDRLVIHASVHQWLAATEARERVEAQAGGGMKAPGSPKADS